MDNSNNTFSINNDNNCVRFLSTQFAIIIE